MFHHALVAFSVLLQCSMSLFISFPVEGHLGFVLQFSAVMKKVAMNIHIEVLRSEHKDLFHLGEDGRARWETSCAQCLFAGNCQASSSPATRIYTPTGNARQFPHFHPRLVLSSVFLRRGMRISGLFSHSDRCIVVSGYGFNLHFPMD